MSTKHSIELAIASVSLRKMLGTQHGPVGTRLL